jgi:Holliday junction DNA helicase RuvB
MSEPLRVDAIKDALRELEQKHGVHLRALLRAVAHVVLERKRGFNNYVMVQNVFRDNGGKNMRDILADLAMNGILEWRSGDIYFPYARDAYGYEPAIVAAVEEFLKEEPVPVDTDIPELPDDLFEDIVGHDDVKILLRAAVLSPKPIHVLLVGPPATAKSMFLTELERALGKRAQWVLGSSASKAGVVEAILAHRPWVILVDELEHMTREDQTVLLSIMSESRVTRTKKGKMVDLDVNIRVVAACNNERRLPDPLRSRFAIKRIFPYTPEEFIQVVRSVLVKREQVSPEDAETIARLLVGRTHDVRDAIKVARAARMVGGIEKAVSILFSGRPDPKGEGVWQRGREIAP